MDPEESMKRRMDTQRLRQWSLEQRDANAGWAWWEELSRHERAHWMKKANSSIPLQCWEAYKRERS